MMPSNASTIARDARSWLLPHRVRLGGAREGSLLLLLIHMVVVLLVIGCGKNPRADAMNELAASFEGFAAKDDVIAATTAFDEGRYRDSPYLLHKGASRGDLTDRQKKAMAGIVGQVLQAVHGDRVSRI